ncbi:hypothetical protein CR513_53561, partial [Mucuna pruriens]
MVFTLSFIQLTVLSNLRVIIEFYSKDYWARMVSINSLIFCPSLSTNPTLASCNILLSNKNALPFCNSCCLAKSHKLPSTELVTAYSVPLQLIYCDLWGPAPILSSMGFTYSLYLDLFIKQKSDTLSVFTQFKNLVELQINKKIKGGEFRPFTQYLLDLGIMHRLICPRTHHQNGVVERKHRHIVEMGLTLLSTDHAFHTAMYLINRLPSMSHNHNIPLQTLFNKQPDYSFLRIYNQCTLLGYSPHHKGYECLESGAKLFIFRDVVFNEDKFPSASSMSILPTPAITTKILSLGVIPSAHSSPTIPQSSHSQAPTPLSTHDSPPSSPNPIVESSSSPISLPTRFVQPMQTRSKSSIVKPKLHPTLLITTIEPSIVRQALSSPLWKLAMQQEYEALIANKTWSLVPLRLGRNAKNSDGSINKYKARLVAKGFHQIPGCDFSETFSLVVNPVTIRIILTLALSNHWPIQQNDINNAFLNDLLAEDVYMQQPEEFTTDNPTPLCNKCDLSLLILKTSCFCLYVLIYVDDILITDSSPTLVQSLISKLHSVFALKQLGTLDYFLGIEVKSLSNGSLLLSQAKYTRDLLHKASMADSKGIATLLPTA